MERQERVARYMEILDKAGLSNCSVNWSMLDKLSNMELFDEYTVTECLNTIRKREGRLENNPNKYPEDIMECVRQSIGIDRYSDEKDEYINSLIASRVFEIVCNWNGLIKCDETIKDWVRDIYKVDLDRLDVDPLTGLRTEYSLAVVSTGKVIPKIFPTEQEAEEYRAQRSDPEHWKVVRRAVIYKGWSD